MTIKALVFGALTPTGRYLVDHLVQSLPAGSIIRATDRRGIVTALLNPRHAQAFTSVEFIQTNLANPAAVTKAFTLPDGGRFDWVFNCASAAADWEVEEVFNLRYVIEPTIVAKEAQVQAVPVYVHLSSALFYADGTIKADESQPMAPLCTRGEYVIRLEEALRSIDNLHLVIVRQAIAWGEDDADLVTTMIIGADLYSRAGQPWELTSADNLRYNTVYIGDVARAMSHLAEWYIKEGKQGHIVYNVADDHDTHALETLLIYQTLFPGITFKMGSLSAEEALPLHVCKQLQDLTNTTAQEYWFLLLEEFKMTNSPIVPHVSFEYCIFHPMYIDGRAIVRDTGFKYLKDDGFSLEDLEQLTNTYMDRGVWPRRELRAPFKGVWPADQGSSGDSSPEE